MARPGDVRQLNKLLEDQAQQRDPFQAPSMVSAREQGTSAFTQGGDPFEKKEPVSLLEERREAPKQNLNEFLSKQDPQAEQKLTQTAVPQQLRQLGFGDLADGLTFNQMGRFNLLLRLKERFGDNFFENDSARNAITIFDQALSKDQQDSDEETSQMIATSDRTLEELFRMQRSGGRA